MNGRHTRRRAVVAAAAVLTLAVAGTGFPTGSSVASASGSEPLVRSPQLGAPNVPAGLTPDGVVPADQSITILVALAPSDPTGLRQLLAGLDDLSSPEYHHWLARGQFEQQFGPTPSSIAAVEGWLHQRGLSDVSFSGLAVSATATASAVTAALGTPFDRYRSRNGHVGYSTTEAPLVPQNLGAGVIHAIVGLDTVSSLTPELSGPDITPRIGEETPQATLLPNDDGLTGCAGAEAAATTSDGDYYTLDELGAAYGIGSLLTAGQNGHGETVGVYELADASPNDVAAYKSCFGLTNPVQTDAVDTGGTASSEGTVEADLDIEQIATQAPDATIVSYQGPNTPVGSYDTWSAIVSDDAAQVVSSSWGECEPTAEANNTLSTDDSLFVQAATQGQTILAASGDSGSEGCYPSNQSTAEEVNYPASDPSVTAVGGTSLLGPGDEVVWNDCSGDESLACANSGGDAGGGGMSRYETRPSYQPNLLVWPQTQACGQSCREVPDISANAGIGMVFYANGSWEVGGGTSFSAPFVAGLIADKNNGCATPTGLLTPALYQLSSENVYGTALNDITTGDDDLTGSNGGEFPAGVGYDAASGVGSPIAAGLSCPEITSVSPPSATPGSKVTVSGLGLEDATISFGRTSVSIQAATATSATVTVPSGSGPVSVNATSALGSGTTTGSFTITAPAPPATHVPVVTPPATPAPTPTPAPAPSSVAATSGYDMVGSDGGVFVFGTGGSGFYGSLPALGVDVHDIVGMVPSPDDRGYFLVGQDGGVFAFGDAGFEGSLPGDGATVDNIRGIVPTSNNGGYFLVGADGGVFAFGNAPFLGSLPGDGIHVNDVIGIAATPDDEGYWVVAADGTVYAFGNAAALGSVTGSTSPVSGIAATPDGGGYWVVTQNGGVYNFGDATSYGSLPSSGVNPSKPVIGLVPTADQKGYWLIGSDGGIFAYGDAGFEGSLPALGVQVSDVVGAVPTKG